MQAYYNLAIQIIMTHLNGADRSVEECRFDNIQPVWFEEQRLTVLASTIVSIRQPFFRCFSCLFEQI